MTRRAPRALLTLALLLTSAAHAALPPAAPDQPPTPDAPAPAPAAPAPVPAATLTIEYSALTPRVTGGVRTLTPVTATLTLPAERLRVLRERAIITTSLDADLKRFLGSVEQPARDARFEPQDGTWVITQQAAVTVNRDATYAAVLAALQDESATRVGVVYSAAAPKRTVDFFLARGVTHHLATGESNYAGSGPARVTNIQAGARKFQDRLFEGNTFSFNAFLGDISREGGFVTGKVISGDSTVDGLGGGICQVSTTVFRSLYLAGLPIKERTNHSYQVKYYNPQGFDAAIYQPWQDLKMTNDTGAALWFQAEWTPKADLRVHVFGQPREETVEVTKARVITSKAPAPTRYVTDRSIRPGSRVQVEWAAPGGVMELERLFKKGGVVVRRETLRSTYRPWGNVYLVNPR